VVQGFNEVGKTSGLRNLVFCEVSWVVVEVGWFCYRPGSTEPCKPRLGRRFARIGKKGGPGHLVFYEVSVNYDGFGAGRCSRKPRVNPKRGHSFDELWCAVGGGNLVFYGVSVSSDGQNLVFLKGLLANTAWSEVCEGSGAQEPDSPRKSMAGGRRERPGAEKHGLESPCTRFGRFCWSETSCFIVFEEFPMAKVSCF
jgi:hypothetical protein